MNPGHRLPALVGELLPRRGEPRIAHDFSAERFAADEIHDESFAQSELRTQHRAHSGYRHTGHGRKPEQRGLRRKSGPAEMIGFRRCPRRGAPQDQRRDAVALDQVKTPGLLACAARETSQPGNR